MLVDAVVRYSGCFRSMRAFRVEGAAQRDHNRGAEREPLDEGIARYLRIDLGMLFQTNSFRATMRHPPTRLLIAEIFWIWGSIESR